MEDEQETKCTPTVYLHLIKLTSLQASGGGGIPQTSPPSVGSLLGPLLQEYRLPPEVHFPLTEGSNTGDHRNTSRPLILFAAQWSVSPIAPACHHTLIRTV